MSAAAALCSSEPCAPADTDGTDLGRARTLPSRAYTDPALLDEERARVFGATWQPVCGVADVAQAGQQIGCQVAGEPLIVLRDLDGRLRAYYDVCPHRAGPLTQGPGSRCQRKTLQCRYHGWTFGLDGQLVHGPGVRELERGAPDGFDRRDSSLRPVAVDTFGPLVFVHLSDPQGPPRRPLLEHLGELVAETAELGLAQMALCERREYPVRSNWKVYVDNYVEGYHIPLVHPSLMRELDYPSYRVETRRWHSKQHAPIRPIDPAGPGDAAAREYSPDDGEGEGEGGGTGRFYWVFPNLMLNCYPDHLQLNVVLPRSVDETVVLFEWYARDPDQPGRRDKIRSHAAFAEAVQAEDAMICEAVQERLRSRAYDTGRFVPAHENGVHHFQSLLRRYLAP
jgi:choline monooxygenase